MFDYYEKREHSLLVLEYLQVVSCTKVAQIEDKRNHRKRLFSILSLNREGSSFQKWARLCTT